MCMIVLLGIRDILWPPKEPKGGGKLIKKRLKAHLEDNLQVAPTRGPGAYLRRFILHAKRVTKSYWNGLFHCYDDPRIPHTSNAIEQTFGKGKRLLRACAGKKTTAVGPGSASGAYFLYTVALHATTTRTERETILKQYSKEEYLASRLKQAEIRGPESRRRQYARNPEETLARINETWDRTEI